MGQYEQKFLEYPGIPEPCSQVGTSQKKTVLATSDRDELFGQGAGGQGVTLTSDVETSVFLLRLWRAMRNSGMDFCSFNLECVISLLSTLVSLKPTLFSGVLYK